MFKRLQNIAINAVYTIQASAQEVPNGDFALLAYLTVIS